jgi:hypothetical protein
MLPSKIMKQLSPNSRRLSLLAPTSVRTAAHFDVDSGEINHSFNGWSEAVNGTVVASLSDRRKAVIAFLNRRPLNSIDSIRVDRATVREGRNHRHWPREVVEKFLAAEIIRSK